jgi:hypothetical protein
MIEYEKILALKHLLKMNLNFDEYKDYRFKEY